MAMAAVWASTAAPSLSWAATTRRISPAGQRRARAAPPGCCGVARARFEDRDSGAGDEKEARITGRREAVALVAGLCGLLAAERAAQAKDIPLFGVRKQLEKAGKAVEAGVKELTGKGGGVESLASKGQKELASFSSKLDVSGGGGFSLSPTAQAGGVAVAELVAVLVAATAVNGLTKVPSK